MRPALLTLLLAVLASPVAAAPESVLGKLESEIQTILDRSIPAVVRVEASRERALSVSVSSGGGVRMIPSITEHSLGTGFVVGKERLVLASAAVVADAARIRVTFASGLNTPAEIVDSNFFYRVAVLRTEEVPEGLKPLEISDREPRVGSFAILCGRAHDAGPSAMLGLVSDTRRAYLGFDRFLVVGTTLTPGESGAPFLGCDGKVVGLGSASMTSRNQSFTSGIGAGGFSGREKSSGESRLACCVPASDLRRIVADVTKHGRIQQAWLGVTIRTEDAVITGVVRDSPARNAGLRPGDRVTRVGDTDVDGRMQLVGILARLRPGTVVAFRLERDGEPLDLEIPLLLRPRDEERSLLAEAEGVRLMGVPEGCQLPLEVDDLVVAVDGAPVRDSEVVYKALIGTGESAAKTVTVIRGKYRMTIGPATK